jgi:hypothetical protein
VWAMGWGVVSGGGPTRGIANEGGEVQLHAI